MKMLCLVSIADGKVLAIECDPKAIGQECLEKACQMLGMQCETEYFGLVVESPNAIESPLTGAPLTGQSPNLPTSPIQLTAKDLPPNKNWINLRNPLRYTKLSLRVKFWVPAHLILQDTVRNLFYLQARNDLFEGRLCARTWDESIKIGGLLAHGDGVKFNPATLTASDTECQRIDYRKSSTQSGGDVPRKSKKPRLSKQRPSLEMEHPKEEETMDTVPFSPLRIYEKYIVQIDGDGCDVPSDILKQIANEHAKFVTLKTSQKSAKYWLLEQIYRLHGYGEEVFPVINDSGDALKIGVGPNGLHVYGPLPGDKCNIPLSALTRACQKNKQHLQIVYINETGDEQELLVMLKSPDKLYRSITEKHTFYSCETVKDNVSTQFVRCLKEQFLALFKDQKGKSYAFDIQRTCREVHDHARRILHTNGIDGETVEAEDDSDSMDKSSQNVDDLLQKRQEFEKELERAVADRILEAITCNVCMDQEIDAVFLPCGHAHTCYDCAKKCDNCPICRDRIMTVEKVFFGLRHYVRTDGEPKPVVVKRQTVSQPLKRYSLPESSSTTSNQRRFRSSSETAIDLTVN